MMNKTYFYLFFGVCALLAFWVLRPYMDLILVSFIIVNLFHPTFRYFEDKLKLHKTIATLLTLLIIGACLLIPAIFLINISAAQIAVLYRDINAFISGGNIPEALNSFIDTTNEFLAQIPYNEYRISVSELQSLVADSIKPVTSYLLNNTLNIGGKLIAIVPLVVVFAFVLWSAFSDYKKLIAIIKRLSPFNDELDDLYFKRITATTNAMVKGSFTIALIQGAFGGIVLWLLGVPYVFFLTILMIFLSIVPLGAGFVTFPVSLLLLATGHYWQGIVLLFMQIVVISNIDNVLRPMLVPKDAEIHPILLLLSILGGVQIFGFLGIIYGPLIMSIFLTTLEVYLKYYRPQVLLTKEDDVLPMPVSSPTEVILPVSTTPPAKKKK
ncbi:MAG: AI-2E family transporter [Candidatus Dojkabacteria bacterium]|nr:MAG: AI-2E family transporter [Candidatus Dojkabacteria bacterium]